MHKAKLYSIVVLCAICFMLQGCVGSLEGVPTSSETLKETVETRDMLDEDGVKQGFTYLDKGLDFFMVIKGAEWEYQKTWSHVTFCEIGNSADVIVVQKKVASWDREDDVSKWAEKIKRNLEIDQYTKKTVEVGTRKYTYLEFQYRTSEDILVLLRYYFIYRGKQVYIVAASADVEFSDEFEDTIDTALLTFLTYDEYEELIKQGKKVS